MKKILLPVVLIIIVLLSPCNLFAGVDKKNIALVKEIFECFGYRIGQRIDRNKVEINGILKIKPQKKMGIFDTYIILSIPSNINENENIIYGLMAQIKYPNPKESLKIIDYLNNGRFLPDIFARLKVNDGIRYSGRGLYPNISFDCSLSLCSFGIVDFELAYYMLSEKRLTSNDEIDKYVSQLYLNEGGCRAFDYILKNDFEMGDNVYSYKDSLFREHMFRIPGASFFKCAKGEFFMGSPESSKKVKILKPFGISENEVSQDLYKDIIGKNPSKFKTNDEHKKRPVENISFDEALAFCDELNKKYRILLPKDYKFDLPTEIQWEYACRSANKDDKDDEGGYAKFWFADNSDNMTHGKYDEYKGEYILVSNRWKLENMRGNVAEWCWDETKQKCVIRGGSFRSSAEECKPFARREGKRDERYDDVGFRIVVTPIE